MVEKVMDAWTEKWDIRDSMITLYYDALSWDCPDLAAMYLGSTNRLGAEVYKMIQEDTAQRIHKL